MPAASHRDEHPVGGSNLHGLPDICVVGTTSDRGRPAIDHRIVDFARRAVLVIAWDDDAAAQAAFETLDEVLHLAHRSSAKTAATRVPSPARNVCSLSARVGGERKEERCSLADHAGDPDATAVRLDDALCDR